jgi:large subunit ribosomal protein L18
MKRHKTTRLRSKTRIRKKIHGTPDMPRLSVYRSLNHIYTQLVDDTTGKILSSASTLSKEIQSELKNSKSKVDKSKVVGNLIAKKATEKKIITVVFDRSGYKYHGRVQAVADGAREGGLKF